MYNSGDWWPHKAIHLVKPAPPIFGVLRGAIAVSLVMATLPFAQRKGRPLRILLALGLMVLAALAFPGSTEATSLNEVKKLTASDAQAGARFGHVAASGDTVIAGAPREDTGATNAGAAYVFQRDHGGAGNWGEVKKLTLSEPADFDSFGFSVAISGDTAIVNEFFGVAGGAAYVFERNEGGTDNWGEVKKLTASDGQSGDRFGWNVAVSGDTAIVGAFLEDSGGSEAGAAYVFQRNEGGADNWGEVTKLTASDAQAGDWFGFSVALSADSAVVGAVGEDNTGGSAAGAAYVFQRDQGGADNWGEVKKLTASDPGPFDNFGRVAVSGDTAVVGAFLEDAGGTDAGAAYVFQRNEGGTDNWSEVKKLLASDAQASDGFAVSVEVSGDTTIVGAYQEDAGGSFFYDFGAAYVFQRNEGGTDNWGEVTKLTASDAQIGDWFGISVAVAGDTAVSGALREDAGGTDAGAAYVFDLLLPKPTPSFTPTATPTSTATPTPTPCPSEGCPVGGIALDSDLRPLSLETTQPSSPPWAVFGIAAVAVGAAALGGGAWYVRRRREGS